MSYSKVDKCRICGNRELVQVLDLGIQSLTGVFPRSPDQEVTKGPLRLVKCFGGDGVCGLLQLEHSYSLGEMYGENYGYRSGLNSDMVRHLQEKVARILGAIRLQPGALIVDIGSNDSTTLQAYPAGEYELVGVDPTGAKFRDFYPAHIGLIPDFFSGNLIRQRFGDRRASVVTSFSMYYDLEDPLAFMRQVAEILAEDGIWVFEQSYMPTMLERNSYDTACHEHLEYYSLKQIHWMAERSGLKVIDVEFNDVNGGSFSVTAARRESAHRVSPEVAEVLKREVELGLDTLVPYREFEVRVEQTRAALREFIDTAKAQGKTIAGLGASTKGNVLLQYCGLTSTDLSSIGEVNGDKFGAYTPGSLIPIIDEHELLSQAPDYLIVLPWHFRNFFMVNRSRYGVSKLVFPLPVLELA